MRTDYSNQKYRGKIAQFTDGFRPFRFNSPLSLRRPWGLVWRGHRVRGTHEHGTVDIGSNHKDAEQDGPDDGSLQAEVVRAASHGQACQVRMAASGMKSTYVTHDLQPTSAVESI